MASVVLYKLKTCGQPSFFNLAKAVVTLFLRVNPFVSLSKRKWYSKAVAALFLRYISPIVA